MSKRTNRVSIEIQRILSEVLIRGLPDDRVTPISVTSVSVSPDLRLATVHYVPMGGLGDMTKIAEGLEACKGFINREVAKRLKMKYSPKLRFFPDEHFFENVDFIEELDRRSQEFANREVDSESDSEG